MKLLNERYTINTVFEITNIERKYRFCFTLILEIQDEMEKGDRLKFMKYLNKNRDNDSHNTMRVFYLYINNKSPKQS